ncbi:Transmembrane protein [Globisporangium polare]
MPRGDTTTTDATAADGICEQLCKKQACAIQFCLQRSDYQERRCAETIKRYYDCCEAAKRSQQQPKQEY